MSTYAGVNSTFGTPFDGVNNAGSPVVRRGHVRRRSVRRVEEQRHASEVIGAVEPGVDLVTVSAGRFTLSAALVHILDATGPADVWLCVPGVAAADLGTIHQLADTGTIRTFRLLVDFQVAARQPALVDLVSLAFGPEALRVGMVHAGFAVVRNDGWNVSVRTSAGLSAVRRLELFEVTDDTTLADFLVGVFDAVSEVAAPAKASRLEHNAAHDRAFPLQPSKAEPVGGANDPSRVGVSYR
jgi:hypothetical protein